MTERLTVKDLRNYLELNKLSPERFAKEVQLSHITIRRWLKKSDQEAIPQKYTSLLAPRLGRIAGQSAWQVGDPLDVGALLQKLEDSGKEFHEIDHLENEVTSKLHKTRLDQIFFDYSKRLVRAIRSPGTPFKLKALAVGALLYFLNPIDLIPDHVPVIGFIDDLAVLAITVNCLTEASFDSSQLENAEPAYARG